MKKRMQPKSSRAVVVPTPQVGVRKSLPEKWDHIVVTTAKENALKFLTRKKEKPSSAVTGVVGT